MSATKDRVAVLEDALRRFTSTITACGGAYRHEDGTYGLDADHDWIDLGEAYIFAAGLLGEDQFVSNGCRVCGEPNDNGEGWNGLCGNCADKAEEGSES